MRLRRLDLTRYGKFTDRRIDFGERVNGQPDLHIIYGPNEAGKSTAFAAFLDLLFGIGSQSPFNFLHPYPTMRIGAALDIGAETREFARLKRSQNSLVDGHDRSVPEAAIRGELGGIERDAYRTMFSLDDETLEKGGESILASKGDLGQLLFSASAGLSHLSDRLVDLTADADSFYKYRARSGALADLKSRLAELKAEREQFDTLATDHARLVDTRDRATVQYDEAVKERAEVQRRVDEIRGYLTALPRLTALRGIRARVAPLADIPEAPQGWVAEVPRLQKQEIELGVKISAVADEIGQLADEGRAVIVDETALRTADRVERLVDLRARYVTAEKDLPERRLQLRELDLAIAGILQRIERPEETEPKRLVLSSATIGRLRDLVEAYSGIKAASRNASDELAEARRRLDDVAAKLPEGGADPTVQAERKRAFAELAVVIEALRSADHHVRRRLAERDRAAALDALNDRLVALRPWQGTGDELVAMNCPSPDTLQNWKVTRGEAVSAKSRCDAEVQRLTTIVRRLEAEKASFASTTGVVSDHEAAEVRSQREQAWAAHRRALDTASADTFEAVLRHDDIVTAGRFSHMGELAKAPRQQARIRKIADAYCDVDAFLDDVHNPVSQSEIDRHFGMTLSERRQSGRDHMQSDRQRRRHPQGARRLRARAHRRLLDRFRLAQQPQRSLMQIATLRRERQRPGRAGEERNPQMPLKTLDALADGRGRDRQGARSGGEATHRASTRKRDQAGQPLQKHLFLHGTIEAPLEQIINAGTGIISLSEHRTAKGDYDDRYNEGDPAARVRQSRGAGL